MSNEDKYFSNLEIWSHSNPREAIWLQYLECENLEICKTNSGSLNLRKKIDGNYEHFYKNGNPLEEADKWSASLDLENTEVLYIYGVGLGYYYYLYLSIFSNICH